MSPAKLDPYSSALSFTGWTMAFVTSKDYVPLPTSPPQSALLRTDWKAYGAIDPDEVPGPRS